ncbi:ABC transporter substrate-binding protein [Dietzia cinnamea]|uniref:ABC transporter substrate-binding protein n=1 Tax=Dietzia cinnamea TaxID=321318 RepID=UPI0021A8CDCB|nr:ABC transporter substrate-binding protein [Dietzia cinnamea]MCT1639683.1 ABC transporter substrate-binding protein [Dietzia cinnamea]
MRRIPTAAAALAITALALSACGSSEADPAAAADQDTLTMPADDARCTEDKAGGTITMGTYVMLPSFSPGQGQVGVRGGAESAAVYDRLVRWDARTETFEPKLAESLESSEDHTVWTLRLREGVTFSNGDPLTAQDVAFTMGLHKDPATRSTAMTDVQQIEQTRVVDSLTVEFTLAEPWSTFPVLLAGSAGEVIPEKAYTEAGPEKWAREPVGAGAFTLASYTPNQEMVLKPNPDYYGGPVCPTLRFIQIPGSQSTLEAFRNGEVEVAFLRGSKFADMAREADAQGYEEITSAGRLVYMNNGAAGYDGILTDQRARQAVTHAIDRELLLGRLGDDPAQATSALLADSSRFFDEQEGPTLDVERATELVTEIKQETGWDGSLTLLVSDVPENREAGIVIKAMLDAVGFDVTVEVAPASAASARQFTGDYEMAIGGLATSDADPASTLASSLMPGGALNVSGVDDPAFADAISALKAAPDVDSQKKAYTDLQEVHNEAAPYAVFGNGVELVTIDESVKGISPTISSTMLFDGAFIEE